MKRIFDLQNIPIILTEKFLISKELDEIFNQNQLIKKIEILEIEVLVYC